MLHRSALPPPTTSTLAFEYQLPHQVVLSAGYVGSRGLFLPLGTLDLNQLDLAHHRQYDYRSASIPRIPIAMVPNQWAPIQPPTNCKLWLGDRSAVGVAAEYPQFGNGSYGSGNGVNVHGYPGGDSEYSSLQTKVQKRLTSHFTALASFTWAKLMTDDGNPPLGFVGSHLGAPQDASDLQLEHSVSPQDVKYQFTGEASYDCPSARAAR